MGAAIRPDTTVVFVANPNNPTGTWLAPGDVLAFIASVPRDVVVVLDRGREGRVVERGRRLQDLTLDEMEMEWQAVKSGE